MEGILDHIGADGVVMDGFAGAVKTVLVAEANAAGNTDLATHYGESKYLDDVNSITSLVKRGMDTRKTNTQLTEAAKNTIARPAEGATDEKKAEFHATLRTELGATGNLDDYKVVKPEGLPEGLPWREEGAKQLAQFCCDNGIPVAVYESLMAGGVENGLAAFKSSSEAKQKEADDAFNTGVKAITDKKSGPEIIEMGTLARKAIDGYGLPGKDAEQCKAVSLATAAAPSDFALWRTNGVPPTSFVWLAAIGKDMVAGTTKLGGGSGETDAAANFVEHCSSASESLQD